MSATGGIVGSARNHGSRVTVAWNHSAGCTAQNGTCRIGSWNGTSASRSAWPGSAYTCRAPRSHGQRIQVKMSFTVIFTSRSSPQAGTWTPGSRPVPPHVRHSCICAVGIGSPSATPMRGISVAPLPSQWWHHVDRVSGTFTDHCQSHSDMAPFYPISRLSWVNVSGSS